MVPRQMRETWRPVRPRRTCCTAGPFFGRVGSSERWLGRSGTRAGTSASPGSDLELREVSLSTAPLRGGHLVRGHAHEARAARRRPGRRAGTSATRSCAVRRTFAKPADSRMPCVRSGSPSANGPVGLLPGRGLAEAAGRCPPSAVAEEPRVPVERLPARERDASARRQVRADVGERGHRLVEEHHAELAHDHVERARPSIGVLLHVGDAERSRCRRRLRRRAAPASSVSGVGDVGADRGPAGPTARAAAIVALPPPQPTSSTRSPGCSASASRRYGVIASVSASRFGHTVDPVLVVPAPAFGFVRFGHACVSLSASGGIHAPCASSSASTSAWI